MARRGKARRGQALSSKEFGWVCLIVEECPFWYFRQSDTVTCQQTSLDRIAHMVQDQATQQYRSLESLSLGQLCELSSHRAQLATFRLVSTTTRSNTRSPCGWYCRVVGARDGSKRQRGSLLLLDSISAGAFFSNWSWWCTSCSEN